MAFSNYTIRNSEVSGCNDGVKSGGVGSVDVSGNVYESGEPANSNPGARYECVAG